MKNKYYLIDNTITPQENLKKLINQNFQKEISLDILRNNFPDYTNLEMNNIRLEFTNHNRNETDRSDKIYYLTLSAYLRKGRKRYGRAISSDKKKSLRIQNGEVNLNYLRKNFENLKVLKENDTTDFQKDEFVKKEQNDLLQEIKTRYNIEYPETGLYLQSLNDKSFQLTFNKLTEDQIRKLMSYWQQIK